jgi:hypothetical protein
MKKTMKPGKKGKFKKEQEGTPVSEQLWKIGYIFLCAILLLVTGYMLISVFSSPGTGWDYRVYMGAVDALNQGKDPYVLDNIKDYVGDNLPFVYPPHTLPLFEFLYFFNSIGIYRLFCFVLLLIGSYLVLTIDDNRHYLFFGTLLMTGFISVYWNFLTGNDSIIFFFFTALIFYLLKKERITESAIVTGLMASFSIFPIVFSAVFLFVKRSLAERIKLICLAGGTLGAILAVSFIIVPSFVTSFFILATTGSGNPLSEGGGMATPSQFLMFGDIAKGLGANSLLLTVIISVLYIVLVLVGMFSFMKRNNRDTFKLYCIGFLTIFMLLPRIKPYAFVMLAVPLYFLMKDYNDKSKLLVFFGISLFPMFVYLNYFINPNLLPYLVNLYAQTMSLFFIFGVIIIYDWYTSVKTKTRLFNEPAHTPEKHELM